MPKYKIGVARISSSGWIANGIGDFLVEVTAVAARRNDIEDVIHIKRGKLGHDVTRNSAVRAALDHGVDYLWMLDHDAEPKQGSFQPWLNYFLEMDGPCVILAPYTASDDTIPIMFWDSSTAAPPYPDLNLRRMTRVEAAAGTGFISVASGGLTMAAFDMRIFRDIVPAPWFKFTHNDDGTETLGGEDDYFCQAADRYGVPIVCAMDHWCGHRKEVVKGKPMLIDRENLKEAQVEYARAVLQAYGEGE